jgi:cobyrinic acid a,c-diamide synthase
VLVVDTQGTTRGVAPLLLGYQAFDPGVTIAGVILNKVAGARHEAKLRQAVEHYTDLAVLGAVHRHPDLVIDERHLGLIPSNEQAEAGATIARIGTRIAGQVNLAQLLSIARDAPALEVPAQPAAPLPIADVRIGIPLDAAFGFYYPGDLDALRAAGAELVFFNAVTDPHLPPVDGLFIGGGFPETQMVALSANLTLREDIREAIESELPAYAECGGLMYLARSIRWGAHRAEMVGVIPGDVVMAPRPIGRGYVHLRPTAALPWPVGRQPGALIHAHEFHYSALEEVPANLTYAFEVARGHGIDGRHDGIVYKNLLAGYAHFRHTRATPWAQGFVGFVRSCKGRRHAKPERGPARVLPPPSPIDLARG